MKVEVCQREKKDSEGMLRKKQKNKAPEPGTESEDESGDERERWDAEGERKKINKIKTEIAKLSQGDWVGRPAMGYFQSQNYTEERLSGAARWRRSQAGSAAATISSPANSHFRRKLSLNSNSPSYRP